MFPAGFEPTNPASERPQTHAIGPAATGVGLATLYAYTHTHTHNSEVPDNRQYRTTHSPCSSVHKRLLYLHFSHNFFNVINQVWTTLMTLASCRGSRCVGNTFLCWIQLCCRTWLAVGRRFGSRCSIFCTRSCREAVTDHITSSVTVTELSY